MSGPCCKDCRYYNPPILGGEVGECGDPTKKIEDRCGNTVNDPPSVHESYTCRNWIDPATVFGLDAYSLNGRMLRNRHTGLDNKVVDVVPVNGRPVIYIGAGTAHDMWSIDKIEEHYFPPNNIKTNEIL